MAAARIPQMNWSTDNHEQALQLFRYNITVYCEDEGINEDTKVALKILRGVGDEGLRRLHASALSDGDKRKPDKLWEFFEGQLKTSVNFRVHRLQLMECRQKPDESLDTFITRARTMALKCEFEDKEIEDRLIEIMIASTPIEDFQKDLLGKPKGYKLQDAIAEGRRYEAIIAGRQQISKMKTEHVQDASNVDVIKRMCGNCGTSHARAQCPAFKATCHYCQKKGHWQRMCRQKRAGNAGDHTEKPNKGRTSKKKFHNMESQNEASDEEEEIGSHTIQVCSVNNREAFVSLDASFPEKGGTRKLKLKVDTGASGNTLPIKTFKQIYGSRKASKILKPVKTRLTAYNGQEIKCRGAITLQLQHGRNSIPAKFYVVEVDGPAIVGLPTCEQLHLVTIHCDEVSSADLHTIEGLKRAYPGQFDTLGDFKDPAHLSVKPEAEPFVDPPRKTSIHLQEKLKEELEKMRKQGVIRKVKEHTDWCSSLAYSVKKDGSLRICIDPQRLNDALKRCPHKVPTLEEINPKFAGAAVFSKLDAKAGYWSVPLDPESQILTTFRTPFGRYCWLRLPFGLRVSQDIFQARMDEILEDLPGVVGITDDVCVYGKDAAEHDRNMKLLMDRAKERGLVFNSDKCLIRQPEISFFGNIYSKDGIRPDPAKIQGIQSMPVPQDKEDLQRFLGMMTYLSSFIPSFSKHSQPLRELLKKDVPFEFNDYHVRCFEALKTSISTTTSLKFFDANKPTVLEVDSSMKGLGAAIIQDGCPVAFASKSLDAAQCDYPNIDREMLAVVFGITRFHTYLFGRPFKVITDHKPLEMIVRKPLLKAPPRLQRMLQKIQGYDFEVEYRSGKTMTLADTLSRMPCQRDRDAIDLDLRVDGVDLSADEISFCEFDFLSFTPKKQYQLREATKADPVLNALMEIIVNGWPENIKALPADIRPYWAFRDELAIEDGIIFKGQEVIIPQILREDVLRQLHVSHQGIEKTRLFAKECAYWPNINRDIEDLVKTCDPCQEFARANTKEPLMPHEVPDGPWKKLGTDLFELEGRSYLLIADYFSKYPVVIPMTKTTSEAVADETEKILAMFGRPDNMFSDNGPQYVGQPFQDLMQRWGIQHVTSSPRYPQSNGFIERQVQIVKNTMKKCGKEAYHIALMNLRATPLDSKLPSPAEILMGKPIATLLPSHRTPRSENRDYKEQLEHRQEKMKENYDARAGDIKQPLYPGQEVRIRNQQTRLWEPGEIIRKAEEPRSYHVKPRKGNMIIRRNRIDLREGGKPQEKRENEAGCIPQIPSTPKRPTASNEPRNVNPQHSPTLEVAEPQSADTSETGDATEASTTTPVKVTRSGRQVIVPARYRE